MNRDDENLAPATPARDVQSPTETSTDAGAAEPGRAAVDVQAYIGRQLRAVYDDVAKQPIPDRFLALMKQLEEQTTER